MFHILREPGPGSGLDSEDVFPSNQESLSSAAHHRLSPRMCQLTPWTVSARTKQETFRQSHQHGLVLTEAAQGAPTLLTDRGSNNVPTSDLASTPEGRGKPIPTFLVLPVTAAEPFYSHKWVVLFHLLRRGWKARMKYNSFFLSAGERCQPCAPEPRSHPQPCGLSRCPPPRAPGSRLTLFSSLELQLRSLPYGSRQRVMAACPLAKLQRKSWFPPAPLLRFPGSAATSRRDRAAAEPGSGRGGVSRIGGAEAQPQPRTERRPPREGKGGERTRPDPTRPSAEGPPGPGPPCPPAPAAGAPA